MTGEREHEGRVAYVTGAASGIGAACARRLAGAGARVAAIDVSDAAATAAELGGVAAACDVSDAAAVAATVRRLAEELGPPDVVVCAAGVGHHELAAGHDEDGWRRTLDVNLSGPFHVVRDTLAGMVERGWGRIVNVSSGAGVRTGPAVGAYGASKAGLIAFTRAVANEAAPHGVTANCVAPGLVDTPMTRALMPDDETMRWAARESPVKNPMGRVLGPDDIAHAVAFLCHPDSWGITGQVLHVNAGALMP